MTSKAKTINKFLMAKKAVYIMQKNQIYVLIAVDPKGIPVGVIRMHDLMQSGLV